MCIYIYEPYEQNLAVYICVYIYGKMKTILIIFSNNYRYSSLLLQQNMTMSGFLKVSCKYH